MAAIPAESLASRNDALTAAVTEAAAQCRESRSVGDLVRLRDLRVKAGAELAGLPDTAWTAERPVPPDLFPESHGSIPEVDLRALSIETLQSAMHHHGALIVRNMLGPRAAHAYRQDIDRVIEAAAAYYALIDEKQPDTRPTAVKADYLPFSDNAGMLERLHHRFVGKSGAIETLLSPSFSMQLFDEFERLGLRAMLQAYFGDEACVSFNKCVLRRTEPLTYPADWHQDGAFMTKGIQSLNLWIALSECGRGTDSPGMDLVPRRLNEVVKTGENGAIFKWSVSSATVAEEFPDLAPTQPYFGAGDAIFFDHFNLHCTSSGEAFTETRYAIENWFFAKGRAATNQYPVFW
ncbi:MAG: hypothetical protein AAF968_00655 [Pseudomonadota bacterium]